MVLETFTDVDSTALEDHDANWHLVLGSGGDGLIRANSLITQDPTGGDWMYSWYGTGGNPGNDQWSSLDVVGSANGWIGPCVRCGDTSSGNGYHLNVRNTEIYFGMFVGGSYSGFGSSADAVSIGDKWKMEAVGTTISVYKDTGSGWTLVLTQTDATFASGHLGLAGYTGNDGRRDNFDGGAVAPPATIPMVIGEGMVGEALIGDPTSTGTPNTDGSASHQAVGSALAASGNVAIGGTETGQARSGLAATGTVAITGTATGTGASSLVATGTVGITGTAGHANRGSAAAAANVAIGGTMAAQAGPSAAASANVGIAGTAAPQGTGVQAASATVGITGTASHFASTPDLAASGTQATPGNLVGTGASSLAAVGTVGIGGTLAASLGSSATAVATVAISGGASAQAGSAASAAGAVGITGTGAGSGGSSLVAGEFVVLFGALVGLGSSRLVATGTLTDPTPPTLPPPRRGPMLRPREAKRWPSWKFGGR